jgi:AraC-like DNA-binding protein
VPDAAVTMGRGVLRPDLAASRFRLVRHQPSAALSPFVEYYWIPRWDLRGKPPYEQAILPHPNVHLVFEASGAGIFGVDRRLFTRSLSGLGLAFGIRFRAGCFRPFWQAPISQLTDRVVPAARLFGPRAEQARQAIMGAAFCPGAVLAGPPSAGAVLAGPPSAGAGRAGAVLAGLQRPGPGLAGPECAGGELAGGELAGDELAGDEADARMIGYAEALLCSALPEPDPLAEQAASLVALVVANPALRRVDELAAAAGLSVRSLQRLFADYVGVNPKWVMRRARLHEAADQASSGAPVDWAALAADLGYADQAHLTRDFTVTIGVSPARYAMPAR